MKSFTARRSSWICTIKTSAAMCANPIVGEGVGRTSPTGSNSRSTATVVGYGVGATLACRRSARNSLSEVSLTCTRPAR